MEKRISPVCATVSEIGIVYGTDNTRLSYLDGGEELYKFDSKNRITYYEEKDNSLNSNNTSYTYEKNEIGKKVTAVKYSAPDYTREKITITQYNDIELPVSEIEDWQNVSDTVKVKTETIYEYDVKNNLISETVTKYTDKSGTITPTKFITKYFYNAQDSLIITENYVEGEELTTGKNFKQTIYDDDGNAIKTISWNSLESSSKFYTESDRAENGQVTADRDETGEIRAEYEYLANSNTVNSVKYPNGGKFAYGRNPYNDRITSVTQCTECGEENTTDIVYADGLPVKVKSGNTAIGYTYEGKGRKKTVTVNGILQSEYSYEDYKKTSPDDVRYYKKSQTFYADGQSYKFVYLKEGSLNDDERRFDAHESLTVGKDTLFIKNYDIDGILTGVTYKNATEERIVVYEYDNYHNLIKAETKNSSGANILLENNTYNEYGELVQKTLTGAVTQTYSYTYKDNAARTLDSVSVEGYTFKPLSDVYGRNTGREIYSGENKLAAEYITYRKVGDHAT
ncbi:MAG: hypothetical protein K2O81_02830, partial [Clostridia bacterium]|nr:hypothetical protein [Clostridia bacterium]